MTTSSPGFRANSTGTYLDQVTGYILFTNFFFLLPKMFLNKSGIICMGSSLGTFKPVYGFTVRTVNYRHTGDRDHPLDSFYICFTVQHSGIQIIGTLIQ